MKTRYSLLMAAAVVLAALSPLQTTVAQDARVQLFNASVDPMMEMVDVYLDDVLWVNDFAYADATPFENVAPGARALVLAPASSASSAEAFKTLDLTIAAGESYHVILNGVLDPGQFPANPDGRDTSLKLFVADGALEASREPAMFEMRSYHGLVNAPALDFSVEIDPNPLELVFGPGLYGDFSPYTGWFPVAMTGYLTEASNPTYIIAETEGNLIGLEGQAFLDVNVGFIPPEPFPGAQIFQWLRVFPDGTVLELGTASVARVQLINGSVDPMMETVDVYLDDVLWYDDFEYATAKPFSDVLAGTRQMALAPAASASSAEAFNTLEMSLLSGQRYHAILSGVLDPAQYDPNPEGLDTSLKLFLGIGAHETSSEVGEFEFRSFHNLFTEGELEFWVEENGKDAYHVHGGVYGSFSSNITHPPYADAVGYIMTPDYLTQFYTDGDVEGLEGAAFLELAVGFIGPDMCSEPAQDLQQLQWLRIFPDGHIQQLGIHCSGTARETSSDLPRIFRLEGNYPNPFNPSTTIQFDLALQANVSVDVFDLLGRRVLQIPEQSFAAGSGQQIHIDASGMGSGTYLYRVIARSGSTTYAEEGRMILLK